MDQDPYRYFRVEAKELCEALGKGVLELEKAAPSLETVSRLLRFAHTLKGAARVVRQSAIAELAHSIEDALAPLRERPAALRRGEVDAVLGQIDAIVGHLAAIGAPADESADESDRLRAPRPTPKEPMFPEHAGAADVDALLEGIAEAVVQVGAARAGLREVERARQIAEVLGAQLSGPRAGASDRTRPLVEDLRAVVTGLEPPLAASLEQIARELRQIREAAERLRLVPVSLVFNPLERTVRDAALATGRRVAFTAGGSDVRLDSHVVGVVRSALVQLVRNAVAHGIEPSSERVQAGKPVEGRVSVEVSRHGNRVSFRCTDDGRGVDLDAVRRIAQRKGLLAGTGGEQSADDLIALLLRGGVTTSGVATDAAGRGVGLDVVRDAAARLGGRVDVETAAGRGTTVELDVPVSMTALQALLVECAGVAAAIPLDAVRSTIRLAEADVTRAADGDAILWDGRAVPFVPLRRALRSIGSEQGAVAPWSAVVVEGGGGLAAVSVDRLLGAANIVVRPLPASAAADPVVAGVALDDEGAPQLVLDPAALVDSALAARRAPVAGAAPVRDAVLVIDDSLTTRMLEQSILESAGYEVDLATSGEEGLSKARRRPYRLFLVDVEMPGIDGFEFLERRRADPALRDVPSILVTSRGSPEDRRRGAEAGAEAYIAKSEFDQTELLATIRRLLR